MAHAAAHELSVVMPVYNGAEYLGAAIDSILSQTFSAFELLVMDDGSTDATPAILASYASKDSRVRVFRRPRRGQIATRNELLQLARSEIVACADADDICLPDRLAQQLRAMSQDDRLWVLGTAMISIDGSGRHRRRWRVPTGSDVVGAGLERGCCIGHPSCMMRRQSILAIGGYRPAYEAAEDYDLFLRASEQGKVDNLEAVGVLHRMHGESVSQRQALRQAISVDLARATHRLRVEGRPDPTLDLAAPPDIEDPLVIALLSRAQMEYHRAMAVTADPRAERAEIDRALRYFVRAPVDKKQALATQRAIVRLLARRNFDRASLAAVMRAASLGPGRLVRLWTAGHPA
jgi:glycosyltransferase involved in cell wall biosynthesis